MNATPLTTGIQPQSSQTSPASTPLNSPNISSSPSQAAAPLPQASERFSTEISKLNQLEEILHKHDGGASAGMSTRHFLRLASALEKLGYFSHFEANQKEVKIKINPDDQTPGLVTVMHTNHTNTSKEAGITRPTAARMSEVIAVLKEKAQASSSTMEGKKK